jgi:hypothetical protein
MDPSAVPSSQPLPPLETSVAPPVPDVPVEVAPPAPTPVKDGTTQSSSKYQSNGPSLEVLPPPPPPRVPPMPGSGSSGN